MTPRDYDDMGKILKNLGFQAEEIQEEDLTSSSTLSKYDAVYINCSVSIDTITELVPSFIKIFLMVK